MSRVVAMYDISDDKVRRKADKILDEFLIRVQYSVFEGILSKSKWKKLQIKLEKIELGKSDSFRIYSLCQKCTEQMVIIGNGEVIEDKAFVII